jgi:phenylacetate-CoA ligase
VQPTLYDPHTETLSRSSLAALQLERLRSQVERCYRHSAFYRERLDRAGASPDRIRSLDDLRRIPFVTKQELRDEQALHPPYGRFTVAPLESWREIHPSSGTTGQPVLTIWSENDVRHITAFTARTLFSLGARPGDVIQNAFSYGLWVAGLAVHYAGRALGCLVIPIGASLTERQLFFLTRSRSTILTATPSYCLHIAEKLAQSGVGPDDLALKAVALGGEAGTEAPSTRSKLQQRLGASAYDYYGLAEIGPTFASECTAQAGLHWSEDHHLIEVIDPETMEPAAPGDVGVLVISHLTREATPMLRYWTNDYARLDDAPCSCGRTHARSPGGILGRHDDLIVFRGAKFYPANVENAVRGLRELTDEYRIELVTGPGSTVQRCTVIAEIVPDVPDEPALIRSLQARLKEECLVTPEVRLVPAGTLERTEFKAKRIIRLEG